MSLQDVLTAPLFKRDQDDRIVMFPNGALGRGYVVPDAATEQRMRRILMWLIISAGLIGGVGSQIMAPIFGPPTSWTPAPWAIAAAALLAVGIAYRLIVARLVRNLTPSPTRLALSEALRRQAEALPRWYLWLMATCALLMVAGSASWIVAGASVTDRVLALAGLALFGPIMVQAIYGLKRRQS